MLRSYPEIPDNWPRTPDTWARTPDTRLTTPDGGSCQESLDNCLRARGLGQVCAARPGWSCAMKLPFDQPAFLARRLRREVTLTPEFKALWDRIKPKTTYRVEFDTEVLVRRAVDGVKRMPVIEKPRIRVTAGRLSVEKGGVATAPSSAAEERVEHADQPIPDVLAYLQNETELTRSTLVRILRESGRLGELFNNPQHFLDAVAAILKHELHRLLVDGIKY